MYSHMQCNRLICVPIIPYVIPKYGPEISVWTIVRIILDYVCSHIFRGYNGDSHVFTTISDLHIIGYIVKYEEWFIEQQLEPMCIREVDSVSQTC